MNRRTYVALGGLGLLGALVAARLIKSAAPITPEPVDTRVVAPAGASTEPWANLDDEGPPRRRDERAESALKPAPEAEEGVGTAAPAVAQASQTRLVLSLIVILALTALIVLLFLKEFLG